MTPKIITTLSVFTLLVVLPAFAERPLRANVPFDFKIGETWMTAGEHTVTFIQPGAVSIRREDGSGACLAVTMAVQKNVTPDEGKLVFNKYGDSYFLSQIWSPGYDQGRGFPKTKAEREMARTIPGEVVAVLARR